MQKRSVKVPVILQMEEMEGGAACLTMILSYFRKNIRLDQVRQACGISRNGIQAADIVRAGGSFCLSCQSLDLAASQLQTQVRFPVVLGWERNQFVVLEGFHHSTAKIIHPAKGRLNVSPDELEKKYSGICISCAPGEQFIADGTKKGTSSFLLSTIRKDGRSMLLVLLTGFLAAAGGIFTPVFSRIFTDDILAEIGRASCRERV